MALTKCKECGGAVAEMAAKCPHCGTGYPAIAPGMKFSITMVGVVCCHGDERRRGPWPGWVGGPSNDNEELLKR